MIYKQQPSWICQIGFSADSQKTPGNILKHIFELRMKDPIEERSSQLLRNLSSCESLKGFLFATA